jgi:hypothetical protein
LNKCNRIDWEFLKHSQAIASSVPLALTEYRAISWAFKSPKGAREVYCISNLNKIIIKRFFFDEKV